MSYKEQLEHIVDEWGMLGTLLVLIEDLDPHNRIDLLQTALNHERAPKSSQVNVAVPTEEDPNLDSEDSSDLYERLYRDYHDRLARIVRETQNHLIRPDAILKRIEAIANGVSDIDL